MCPLMNKITNGLSLVFPQTFVESANVFGDYESDFYRYMVTQGNLAPKTSRDYQSFAFSFSKLFP